MKKTKIVYEDEIHTMGGAWLSSYESFNKPKNSNTDKKVKRAGWKKQFYEK